MKVYYYVLFRHLKKEGHSWWKIILSKLKCIFPFLAAKSVIWYYYSFNEISCYHQEGGESSHLHKFPKGGCEHNAHKFYQITLPTLFFTFLKLSVFAPQPTHTQRSRSLLLLRSASWLDTFFLTRKVFNFPSGKVLVPLPIKVFQIFLGHGNQSFLRTTLPPDNKETLRFVIQLSFLLWPGL